MQILWLKRDLRLRDHEPLRQALAGVPDQGAVLPLYVHEPSLIGQTDFAAQHGGFIRETLDELHDQLRQLGGVLCEQVGEAVTVLDALWQAAPFKWLWAYQETGTAATFERDKAVHRWCLSRGVAFVELPQNAVRRGRAYREEGFKFREHLNEALSTRFFDPAKPSERGLVAGAGLLATSPLPRCNPLTIPRGRGRDKPGRLKGGRSQAQAHLDDFLVVEKLLAYPKSISSPNTAVSGCSRLSPYLAFGVISDREAFQQLNQCVERASAGLTDNQAKELQESVRFFAERLYWRCAYLQSFETQSSTEIRNDLSAFDGERESELAPEWLDAWQRGETGYPMVDAAMKMLAETGWLNMRLRGLVTSFAVNELWLPWKQVGMHLAREFLDYEPGIHWNQLQIHSGSSRLSGPLTYSAVKQAQDQDPRGRFVRQWLPALASVPAEYQFEPWKMPASVQFAVGCRIGQDYPAPLVAHQAANDAARQRVTALRDGKPVPNLLYWRTRAQALFEQKQTSLF